MLTPPLARLHGPIHTLHAGFFHARTNKCAVQADWVSVAGTASDQVAVRTSPESMLGDKWRRQTCRCGVYSIKH